MIVPRLVIVVIFSIYIRTGRTIYERRKQLQNFHSLTQDSVSIRGEIKFPARIALSIPRGQPVPGANTSSRFGPVAHCQINISATTNTSCSNYAPQIYAPLNYSTACHGVEDVNSPGQSHTEANTTRLMQQRDRLASQNRRRIQELNNAVWAYTKCAMLCFAAILITWIPSSANRLYSVIYKNEISVMLVFMSAFVIPLQGFWNGIIYTVTSWSACKSLWHDLWCNPSTDVAELIDEIPPLVPPKDWPRQQCSNPVITATSVSQF